ncbi:MAG: DUF4360 domain-containing protein [Polyangiales bacterium]
MQTSSPHTAPVHRLRRLALATCAAACLAPGARASAQVADEVWPLRDPSGAFTAEVRASGEGCAFNTWRPTLAPDGKILKLTFTQLLASVSPNLGFDRNDCAVDLTLRTTAPRSFAVRRFGYWGTADLEPGIHATASATYLFAGARFDPAPHIVRMEGPFRSAYTLTRAVPSSSVAWSPCGLEHDLSMLTVLSVANGKTGGWGNVSMSGAASAETKLLVELDARACDGAPTVAPAPGPIAAPTGVVVQPTAVRGDQPFTVRWQPLRNQPDALFVVQLSTLASGIEQVIWQSPETVEDTSLRYEGPALKGAAGVQHVVRVLARVGTELALSDPTPLRVLP